MQDVEVHIMEVQDLPVPGSHKRELRARREKHAAYPGKLLTLEELQKGIEKRKALYNT